VTVKLDVMDSFAAYQKFTRTTAIYPGSDGYGDDAVPALSYLGLGLVGESGEIADKVKKVIRDGNSELTDERREAILAEAGDVLWYVTRIADHIGVTLGEIVAGNKHLDSFSYYQGRVVNDTRWIDILLPKPSIRSLNLMSLNLCQWSGSVAGSIAHTIAGGPIVFPSELKPVLDVLTGIVDALGGNLGDVAAANVKKLSSRKDRDVLTGSGDRR
jgi:hypothetical protein